MYSLFKNLDVLVEMYGYNLIFKYLYNVAPGSSIYEPVSKQDTLCIVKRKKSAI